MHTIHTGQGLYDPPWELRRRGMRDAQRHDKRVKEAIKKNLRELIAEETIITSDGTKTVKIPLKYLDQYRFKYGQPPQGVGQGQGKKGDVLGQTGQGNQPGPGQPGDQPGEQTYEAEFSLEELTQMMLEDLALPWLQEKPRRQITIQSDYRFDDVRKKRSFANLDKKRTLLANLKRNAAKGEPYVHDLTDDDLRCKVWDNEDQSYANAAVYMLMDRSGSMTTSKKYIAKSFFFWMVRFLRLKYQNVEVVFIAHDTQAQIVPEKDFFALSNSGGTLCSSAYRVALDNILVEHPKSHWNTYLFHFSDGDNLPADNEVCKQLALDLLQQCEMVGYGEIRYREDEFSSGWWGPGAPSGSLQTTLKTITHPRMISVTISSKEQLYQTLQTFLHTGDRVAASV